MEGWVGLEQPLQAEGLVSTSSRRPQSQDGCSSTCSRRGRPGCCADGAWQQTLGDRVAKGYQRQACAARSDEHVVGDGCTGEGHTADAIKVNCAGQALKTPERITPGMQTQQKMHSMGEAHCAELS